jgi:hypothetical protein
VTYRSKHLPEVKRGSLKSEREGSADTRLTDCGRLKSVHLPQLRTIYIRLICICREPNVQISKSSRSQSPRVFRLPHNVVVILKIKSRLASYPPPIQKTFQNTVVYRRPLQNRYCLSHVDTWHICTALPHSDACSVLDDEPAREIDT